MRSNISADNPHGTAWAYEGERREDSGHRHRHFRSREGWTACYGWNHVARRWELWGN